MMELGALSIVIVKGTLSGMNNAKLTSINGTGSLWNPQQFSQFITITRPKDKFLDTPASWNSPRKIRVKFLLEFLPEMESFSTYVERVKFFLHANNVAEAKQLLHLRADDDPNILSHLHQKTNKYTSPELQMS